MKITDKLRKELDNGLTISEPGGLTYYRIAGGQWYRDSKHTKGEVIKISIHELPDTIVEDYEGTLKVRYKTKQELDIFYREDVVGLPFGEPIPKGVYPGGLFTTSPHPYEGKRILIDGHEGKMRKTLQEKAFALGYKWVNVEDNTGTEVIRDECFVLYLHRDKHLTRSTFDLNDSHHNDMIKLTPQQFLEGHIPVINFDGILDWAKPESESFTAGYDPYSDSKQILHIHKGNTKPDAFVIEGRDSYIYLWTEANKRLKEAPGSLYRYNLMHCNEYFAKHPSSHEGGGETEKFGVKLGEGTDWAKPGSWAFNSGNTIDSLEVREVFPDAVQLAGEGLKPDAYINDGDIFAFAEPSKLLTNLGDVDSLSDKLHLFNLMSKEDFLNVHRPELKFKEWDVEKHGKLIHVGCEQFSKHKLALFSKTMQTLNTHQVDAKEFYTFLYCNKENLGLDF